MKESKREILTNICMSAIVDICDSYVNLIRNFETKDEQSYEIILEALFQSIMSIQGSIGERLKRDPKDTWKLIINSFKDKEEVFLNFCERIEDKSNLRVDELLKKLLRD